jgi:hypothetical protein
MESGTYQRIRGSLESIDNLAVSLDNNRWTCQKVLKLDVR